MINMAQMPVLLWCLPGKAGNLTYYPKCYAEIVQSSFSPPLNVCMDFQKNLKFQALAEKWLQPPFCFRQFPPHVEHTAVPRLSRADIKKQWDMEKQQGRATVKILAWASGNMQFCLRSVMNLSHNFDQISYKPSGLFSTCTNKSILAYF